MARNVKRLDRIDHKIIFVLVSLIIYGLVMIFSIVSAKNNMGVFIKQLACMGAGIVMMVVFHFAHVGILRKLTILIYISSYAMIFFLLLPSPYTVTANGAKRWINVGGFFSFQVAEYVKLAVILVMALWVETCKNRENTIKGEVIFFFLGWAMGGIPALLLMFISNDLSSSAVILGITFIITFVSSKHIFGVVVHILFVLGVVIGAVFIVRNIYLHMPTEAQIEASNISFRTARIAAWLAPDRYAKTVGFQPLHCLYAIANGGWFGKGLGQSWQKSILPMSDNDVIFAIIIEELGIFGGLVLIFLFAVLITLMCNVAYNIKDTYNRVIILGVVIHIMLQVLIHCGVCTNTIPNTGIGLPFISSGMTASLFQLFEMAMVLSITRRYLLEIEKKEGIDLLKYVPFANKMKDWRENRKQEKIRKKNKKNEASHAANEVVTQKSNTANDTAPSRSNRPAGGSSYPRSYREKYGDRLYERGRQGSARVGRNGGSSTSPVGQKRRYSNHRNDYHSNLHQTRNGEFRGRDNFSGRGNDVRNRDNFNGRRSDIRSRDNFSGRSNDVRSRNNSNVRKGSSRNEYRNITHFDPNRRNR